MELIKSKTKIGLLSTIQFSVKANGFIFPMPFTFSKRKNKLQVDSSKIQVCKGLNVYCIFFFMTTIGHILWFWKKSDIFVKAIDGTAMAIFLAFFPSTYLCVFNSSDIANLLNRFIMFETKRRKGNTLNSFNLRSEIIELNGQLYFVELVCCYTNPQTKRYFWLQIAGIFMSIIAVPHLLICANIWINPCFPVFVGFWKVPKCANQVGFTEVQIGSSEDIVITAVIGFVVFCYWVNLCCPSMLVCCIAMIKGFCLASYLNAYNE